MKIPSLLQQVTRVPLERPCPEPWDHMVGDDRVRHCGACDRDVYDLSAMSPREAELRLLNSGERAPCVRYARYADGSVMHAAEPRGFERPAARPGLAAAAALGVTLSAASLHAKEPRKPAATAPDHCVAYLKQADVDGVVVAAAEPSSSGAAAAAAPPAAAARPAAAAAPAAAQPTAPPPPIPLGGAVAPIQQQPKYGTVSMKSSVDREVTLIGIKLHAPIAAYLLTPGEFVASVRDPSGKVRAVKFRITVDKTTVVDLDKK